MGIAEILKELRARGLNQLQIAKRTRIPQPRLSRWESGAGTGSADDALRLERLLRETPAPDKAAA